MYLHVTVTPGAKRERIAERSADAFEIAVREKAERNLANTRVREILAARFAVALSQVRIISGHRSHKKIITIG